MKRMYVEDWIRALAGSLVLLSLALGLLVNHWWFLLTGFVGVNLLQSGITKWCLAERILIRFGMKSGMKREQ